MNQIEIQNYNQILKGAQRVPLKKIGFVQKARSDVDWVAPVPQVDVDDGRNPRSGLFPRRRLLHYRCGARGDPRPDPARSRRGAADLDAKGVRGGGSEVDGAAAAGDDKRRGGGDLGGGADGGKRGGRHGSELGLGFGGDKGRGKGIPSSLAPMFVRYGFKLLVRDAGVGR